MKMLVIMTMVVLVVMTIPLIALTVARNKFIRDRGMARASEAALRAQLESTLDPREKVLWFDKPDPEREYSTQADALVLFAVFWTLFSVFFTCLGSGMVLDVKPQKDIILALFGVALSIFGFFALVAPYWLIKRAFHTTYVLTDRRAIEVCEGKVKTLIAYSDPNFGPISLIPYQQNYGDISFYQHIDSEGHKSAKGFFGIKDPQQPLGILESRLNPQPVSR